MNSFYLAASYGRRQEIARYAADLRDLGYAVTSRWLDGVHEASDATATEAEWERWAFDDWKDVAAASGFIAFTEDPGNKGRGGRHVEWGIALQKGCYPRIIVGPAESMFYALADTQYDSWEQCLAWLRDRAAK